MNLRLVWFLSGEEVLSNRRHRGKASWNMWRKTRKVTQMEGKTRRRKSAANGKLSQLESLPVLNPWAAGISEQDWFRGSFAHIFVFWLLFCVESCCGKKKKNTKIQTILQTVSETKFFPEINLYLPPEAVSTNSKRFTELYEDTISGIHIQHFLWFYCFQQLLIQSELTGHLLW